MMGLLIRKRDITPFPTTAGQPKSLLKAWPLGSVLRLLPDSVVGSTHCSKTVSGLQGGWGGEKGNY